MKKQTLYRYACLLFFLVQSLGLMATHIIGGEINYRCLGNNMYEITLQLFRDCDTGVPWFQDPASIQLRDQFGNPVDTIQMHLRNNDTLDFTASACSLIPSSACIHTTTYREVRFLPFRAGGYLLTHQICCRNQDIINIVSPTSTEATYQTYMSEEALLTCDNSANFDGWPPFYICNGQPLSYDHSAIDLDGDSLVYELCHPFDDFNNFVTWKSPYSMSNMMGGPAPFSINAATGVLSGTPFTNGTFVVGICVRAYRNNQLISRTVRDFQFIVTPCVTSVFADFSTNIPPCNDLLDITFNNLSSPANGPFLWDFGDNSPTSDEIHPVHAYADTGTYQVMLISGIGTACVDTTFQILPVYISAADIDVVASPIICNADRVLLVAHNIFSDYNQITNYSWSPASNIISGQGTDSVWFAVNGTSYSVIVVATNGYGCQDQVQLTELDIPIDTVNALFDSINLYCNHSLTIGFTNRGTATNNQFLWLFDSLATSTDYSPSYTFPDTGIYTVTLIAGVGQPCTDTFERILDIPLSGMSIEASAAQVVCITDTVLLVANSLSNNFYPITDFHWTPTLNILAGQGTDSIWVIANSDQIYTVISTNTENCKDTAFASVNVSSISPTLTLDANPTEIYVGQQAQLEANFDNDHIYDWIPDTTLSAIDIHNPTAKPRSTKTYYLTVNNSFGCQIMDSITITVLPPLCDNPVVFVPSAFSPDGDGYNDRLMVNGNNITEMRLMIYNRWGEKVFETQDQSFGWDGRYKGKALPPDVYGYYMECACEEGGTLLLKGNVTLLR